LGTDHVGTKEFAGLAVENRLDHAFRLAERDRLAVADKREMPDFDLVPGLLGSLLGKPDAGDLRTAIGAGRDVANIERVHIVDPGDPLDADHPFMARLVRQPRRADEIANAI